uniref:Histone chaperone domain-containing protein n=1 Tax=Oryza punctata TaxID=4537 RepID=A0A0E0KPY8_ORYPU
MAATDEAPATDPAHSPSPSPAKRKPDAEATDLAPLDPAEAKARAVDKGKGKMVVEEEEEEEEEDEGGSEEDSSDDDEEGGGGGGGGDGDGSDDGFCDDPLAEVDLNNILPSRTRRRAPPLPGAYLVPPEEAAEDDDDDEDADVDVDMARGHDGGNGEDSD